MKFTTSSLPKIISIGVKFDYPEILDILDLTHSSNFDIPDNTDLILINRELGDGIPTKYRLSTRVMITEPYVSAHWIHQVATNRTLIKDNHLISIYTSTYNIKDKIIRAYNSLNEQSYTNWEWVIVDDSTDDGETLQYLDQIAEIDDRVKVYSLRNKTKGCIGEAKYRASMLCSGVVCVEFDHDDILTHDCIELIHKAYLEHPDCGFYYSDAVEYDFINQRSCTYGEPFGFGYCHHYSTTYRGVEYLPSNAPRLNAKSIRHIVSVPNHVRAWRTDILRSIGGYCRGLRIADDYELIVRTFLHTKFCYIPKMLYIQSMGDGNSQDSMNNRADIQIRVSEIADFYSQQITKRLTDYDIRDPFAGMTSYELHQLDHSGINETLNEILDL